MSRFKVTVSGVMVGSDVVTADRIRADAAPFLEDLEEIHSAIVPGSVVLESVEDAPDAPATVELQLSSEELRIVEETLRRFRETVA